MAFNLMKIFRFQKQILTPISLLSRNLHNSAIEVTWEKPSIGWTKLNFDGSFRDRTGMATVGGVFRNHKAEFLLGYAEQIGKKTSTLAELSALHRGLELVLENGWRNVWLEGDAKTLVDISLDRKQAKCEEVQCLLRVINLMMPELNNCYLTHIYREGNRVADKFAKMGHDSKNPRIWRSNPPLEIVPIVRDDAEGKIFLRKR